MQDKKLEALMVMSRIAEKLGIINAENADLKLRLITLSQSIMTKVADICQWVENNKNKEAFNMIKELNNTLERYMVKNNIKDTSKDILKP